MVSKNCFQIKDLEERLACLEEKYKNLTSAIEQERTVAMISDEAGNIHDLFVEREFIRRQLETTKARLKSRKRFGHRKKGCTNIVNIGSRVKLQNHAKELEIRIVEENEASPSEGYISKISPIGKAILGRSKGEEVIVKLPEGKIEYTIKKIF